MNSNRVALHKVRPEARQSCTTADHRAASSGGRKPPLHKLTHPSSQGKFRSVGAQRASDSMSSTTSTTVAQAVAPKKASGGSSSGSSSATGVSPALAGRSALASTMMRPIEGLGIRRAKMHSTSNHGNDYSNYFVHTGVLPQSWVRNIESPFEGYPKLAELHRLKKLHTAANVARPIGLTCAASRIPAKVQELAHRGAQFDVVAINGCVNRFSFSELKELRIDLITPRPSLLFLWTPSAKIGEGRKLMESWGFRSGEDITFCVTSQDSIHMPHLSPWNPQDALLTPSTWHCLMGLKGTLRRSTDADLINCNVDTDVILEKQSAAPKNVVPEEFYNIVENFTSMKRKLHIVPHQLPEQVPVRVRPGWVVMAPDVFSVGELRVDDFKQRKLVPVKHEIDVLRPRTPVSMR